MVAVVSCARSTAGPAKIAAASNTATPAKNL
jgi:hypothetical protein